MVQFCTRALLLVCLVCTVGKLSDGAKILCIFNAPSKSHYVLGESLMVGLAERGHEVMMVSPFHRSKATPNYKEIVVKGAQEFMTANSPFGSNLFKARNIPMYKMLTMMLETGYTMTNLTILYPEFQNLLKSGAKFDMLISETFLNDALFGLAHQFEAIPVGFSTIGPTKWTNHLIGNPNNPAYNPNLYLGFTSNMNYWERMANTMMSVAEDISYKFHLRNQNALYKEAVKDVSTGPVPDLEVILNNVALILLNTHVAVGYPRANVPNMVDVAGIHIKEGGKLPKDLQEFLDSAKDGAIYFAMGGNVRSADFPIEIREAFIKALGKLKQKVLWKFEEDILPGQPKNVMIRPWMPQQEILAHPNVKCFITHGGGLSSIEAINFGVPLVGIPVLGDQHLNMARAVKAGYGIQLNFNGLTTEMVSTALDSILNDPSYRNKVKALSAIFRDEPQKPLERAIHSVEYVLRHKGAHFLRSPSLDMSVIQTSLLDVWAGIFVIAALLLAIPYLVLRTIYRMVCGKSCSKKKKTAKESKKTN